MDAGASKRHATEGVAPEAKSSASGMPPGLWITATILRSLFICTLIVITLRVSMPQNETILSSYETPGDLIRLALGVVVSIWLLIQLFRGPADANGCRTWIYIGAAAIPVALICLFATW